MPVAGYACLVRKSGTSTAVTAEPIALVAGLTPGSVTFRITDSAKRVIDPNVDFCFQNGTTTLAYSTIASLDYMNGIVVFTGAQAGGSVTSLSFYGNYLPITTSSDVIMEATSFKLSDSTNLLGTDVFTGGSINVRRRLAGLKDVSLDVESLATDADLSTLETAQQNGTNVVTEVYFGDVNTPRFRGICLVESVEESAAVDGLKQISLAFKIAAVRNATAGQVAGYAFKAQP